MLCFQCMPLKLHELICLSTGCETRTSDETFGEQAEQTAVGMQQAVYSGEGCGTDTYEIVAQVCVTITIFPGMDE